MLTYIDDPKIDWLGKRVFCRLDLNVPMDSSGQITDDTRILASLDTLRYLLAKGARVVIGSHLGRPKGKERPELSLQPVAERLHQLLNKEVIFVHDCIGDGIKKLVSEMKPGSLMCLENLRFHSSEEKNEESFAKILAQGIDVYVGDAFGCMHRAHASVDAMTRFVPTKYAGFLVKKELEHLGYLIQKPQRPFVAIIAGAKVSDKIGVLGNLLGKIDTLIIGGAMAYTFLKAKGVEIGASKFEEDRLNIAKALLEKASKLQVQVILPTDHRVVQEFSSESPVTTVSKLGEADIGIDIGPETLSECERAIHHAKTIFWNGPVGVFEWDSGLSGTLGIANAIAESKAMTVVGGGDSIAALKKSGVFEKISHVSTGGGASLEFIQGLQLPGLSALGRLALS